MKIDFRSRFTTRHIGNGESYQLLHDEVVMTVLKGDDILDLTKAPFLQKKHGWYSHIYTQERTYTGMSGNGTGVLNRTRKHLDPKNTVEYKDGIQTVIVLTCKHRDLSTDVLFALEHTFTQLSGFGNYTPRNATGTHFNLKNEDEVYDWARSYAIYLRMFKNQGFTQYNLPSLPFKQIGKTAARNFRLQGTDIVIENYEKKKLKVIAGSRFAVPSNIIVENCQYMSIFNELVKSNVVLPYYDDKSSTMELVFMEDYFISKRFNLDELSSLFLDEQLNDAADKWKNNSISLKTHLNANITK